MITVINTIKLSKKVSPDEAKALFLSTAPKYVNLAGLIRKCYILSDDGFTAGGIYLWQTRSAADACYTEAWKAFVREKYGSEPVLTYMESPVVVDNLVNRIITD